MPRRKTTEFIAVHCSATPPAMDIGRAEIAEWHKARNWDDIGYNIVIRRNGVVEIGRDLMDRGAHVAGFNDRAVGVCWVGGVDADGKPENNMTNAQRLALEDTLRFLWRLFPNAVTQGHRDFPNVKKACPSFDVALFVRQMMRQLPSLNANKTVSPL